MNQQNDNFLDKTFTIMADIVIKVLPASQQEKEAFTYYKEGLVAQSSGQYAQALESYYEALQLEEDGIYGSIYSHADLASTDTGECDGRGA